MDLESAKKTLRFSHDKLDDEILFNIEACQRDLMRVGITKIDENDPLIRKLEELYLKWQYNFMSDGERYEKAYKGMRNGLSLCGDYCDR